MNTEKLQTALAYFLFWSDFLVVGTFVFFIITFWMAAGIDWNTVATVGDLRVWGWKTVFFVAYIFPLISFIAWFPWAFMKKRKTAFFSRYAHPAMWVFAIILLLTYFFANHYTFSNISTNTEGYSLVGAGIYTLLTALWVILFYFSMFVVFITGVLLWPYRTASYARDL